MDKGKPSRNKPGKLHLNPPRQEEETPGKIAPPPEPGHIVTPQPPPAIEPDPDTNDPKMQ
jgi:hypothetical protein